MHVTEVELEDISVMCVVAKDGPSGARAAFDELESKLPSLRGRKFYGTYHEGEYRACVAMNEGDDSHAVKLSTWVIPGGRYLREKVDYWEQKIEKLPSTFESMARTHRVDRTRPSVEFYRSQRELLLLLPIE